MATTVQQIAPGAGDAAPAAGTNQTGKERRIATMLLLPALIFLLLMTIFPTIYSLWLSMQQYNLSRPDLASFVGLRNYGQLLQDDLFWKSVRLTLTFSFVALALQMVIGFIVASFFDRGGRTVGIWRTLSSSRCLPHRWPWA